MFVNRITICVAVLVIVAVTLSESLAQQSGNSGNTGSSSNSRTSSGSGGGSSGTTTSFVQEFSLDSTGTTSGNTTNSFIGGAGNTGFIGGTGTTTGNRNTAGTRTTTMSSGSRNRANTATNRAGQMGGGNMSGRNSTQVQPVITLGFTAPARNFAGISDVLSQRVDRVEQTGRLGAVRIELANGVTVVRGTVASEHDKKVTENMVRLQPGVSAIDNDIQIETSVTPANTLSPSVRRNQQTINVDGATTPQGRPLVHVFPSGRQNQPTINFDDAITPQGRPFVHVF